MGSIRPKKYVFALDCADASALAQFYAELLGWQVDDRPEYPDWVDVLPPEGNAAPVKLGCQQIENYRPPTWPDGPIPQQAHLDFYVDSIAESSIAAEAAGAVRHSHQPSEDGNFVVFLDPEGHPFCLCEE
ncbi:MAG TPA: VOC family protein [Candidatus Agrococcus pullicola]|uniref:VOC family protein n=1 Tax=Candidatus Agrococcus pullicola TaxID=2838429 RepID=A0A9D2C7K3_9MICO|nr:VOC family protein [Candidatus Agrococcus pullicola]